MHPVPSDQSLDHDGAVQLTSLESSAPLRRAFNAALGTPRLILLVSPTCPVCLEGARVVEDALRGLGQDHVAVDVVWLPVLEGDDRRAAELAGAIFASHRRVDQFWDGERVASRAVHALLGLDRFDRSVAWDLYLVYDAEARWSLEPPTPLLWMQQLRIEEVPELDGELLSQQLVSLLPPGRTPAPVDSGT